jgi:sugar phosphate isomerase/epimerase
MRVGFLSTGGQSRIEFAKRHGFSCIELLADPLEAEFMPGHDGWQDKARCLKEEHASADIRISCIGAFYMNHMDPACATQGKQSVRNAILCAEEIRVPSVAGFAGRIDGRPIEESLPKFKEIWGEHARFAEGHGVKILFEGCGTPEPHGLENCFTGPEMYERCFNAVPSEALGMEYDPSHLVAILADPLPVIRSFGSKIWHVHAKGAKVDWDVVRKHGFFHSKAVEHCFPGFGDEKWGEIIKELRRAGYQGDLNIEGWHDAVFHDPKAGQEGPLLEDAGLIIAGNHLRQFCPAGF